MIVLDYPKKMQDMSLVVPPFHTGHLGLIPGTPVTVGLMAPFIEGPTSCELVISPFSQRPEDMAVLTCTLRDDIGVVQRLLTAISDLSINIVTQESSVLNHLNHHFVTLLLDLSTSSRLHASPSHHSVISYYTEFDSLMPVHDFRYVEIFESIMARCAEVINWKEVSGKHLPQLQIRPLSKRDFKRVDNVVVQRDTRAPYHVKIPLPGTIASLLLQYLGAADGRALSYLLVSDTDERVLRAFFPTFVVTDKLVHVGFYHDDVPGALSALLRALARARFNIVAGLLRKHETSRNVWEAVLEYRGNSQLPSKGSGQTLCEWVASNLVSAADNPIELERCRIEIGLPQYPKSKSDWLDKVNLNSRLHLEGAVPIPRQSIGELLTQRLEAIGWLTPNDDETSRVRDLVLAIQKRVTTDTTPTLFLSYPRNAERHAKLVKDRFRGRYQIVDYMVPDGEVILDEVMRRILGCDYFIGIWQHDEGLPKGAGMYDISPWMPFEFGIAFAAGKNPVVIHSERLDERVWKRITPGVSNPQYSDIYFSETLDLLDDYCKRHMK